MCRAYLDRTHTGNSIETTQEVCSRQLDKINGEANKVPHHLVHLCRYLEYSQHLFSKICPTALPRGGLYIYPPRPPAGCEVM